MQLSVGMANQKLLQLQNRYVNGQFEAFRIGLDKLATELFDEPQIDVMWRNASQAIFKVVVLNTLGNGFDQILTIKGCLNIFMSADELSRTVEQIKALPDPKLNRTLVNTINGLLLICGNQNVLLQVFQLVREELTRFIQTHDFEAPDDALTPIEPVDQTQSEGTKHLNRLLVKYGFTDRNPYIFESREEPTVNLKHLEKWALRHHIIVSVHHNNDGTTCNIEACYFQLYQKLFGH